MLLKVIIEGLPREIAALVEAMQDQPELRAIRRKPFNERIAPGREAGIENKCGLVTSNQIACGSITHERLNRLCDEIEAAYPGIAKAIEDDVNEALRKAQGADPTESAPPKNE